MRQIHGYGRGEGYGGVRVTPLHACLCICTSETGLNTCTILPQIHSYVGPTLNRYNRMISRAHAYMVYMRTRPARRRPRARGARQHRPRRSRPRAGSGRGVAARHGARACSTRLRTYRSCPAVLGSSPPPSAFRRPGVLLCRGPIGHPPSLTHCGFAALPHPLCGTFVSASAESAAAWRRGWHWGDTRSWLWRAANTSLSHRAREVCGYVRPRKT